MGADTEFRFEYAATGGLYSAFFYRIVLTHKIYESRRGSLVYVNRNVRGFVRGRGLKQKW
jgi:hypothetical protein